MLVSWCFQPIQEEEEDDGDNNDHGVCGGYDLLSDTWSICPNLNCGKRKKKFQENHFNRQSIVDLTGVHLQTSPPNIYITQTNQIPSATVAGAWGGGGGGGEFKSIWEEFR